MKRDNAITVTTTGTTVTTALSASAAAAVPNGSNGSRPYYVRVSATTESYIKFGPSGVSATVNDLLVQPADAVVLALGGSTHFSVIQGTSAGKVNIVPLEDS